MHIDHTTLRTAQLEKTKDFLLKVFELSVGKRPDIIARNIPGYWLYFEDKPLIHLIESSFYHHSRPDNSSEAIDHTAFYMEGYEAFKNKLIMLHIPFSKMDLPDIGERRLFIQTPTEILLEVVFRA
ncbi:MAG TPA: VOC family protein [Arachidicoccus sp.]